MVFRGTEWTCSVDFFCPLFLGWVGNHFYFWNLDKLFFDNQWSSIISPHTPKSKAYMMPAVVSAASTTMLLKPWSLLTHATNSWSNNIVHTSRLLILPSEVVQVSVVEMQVSLNFRIPSRHLLDHCNVWLVLNVRHRISTIKSIYSSSSPI